MLQQQFPAIMVQSPVLYKVTRYRYCPYETVQIVHNDARHWLLLSSMNGVVTIYDSLDIRPNNSLKDQMKQLFSPDNSLPPFQQKSCHKQTGSNDCGVFAIAYAVGIFNGIEPDKVIYDQSKMRPHLIQCFEEKQLKPFPIYRNDVSSNKVSLIENESSSEWIVPRRSARLAKIKTTPNLTITPNKFDVLDRGDVETDNDMDCKSSTHISSENISSIDHDEKGNKGTSISTEDIPMTENDPLPLKIQRSRVSDSSSVIVNLSDVKLTEAEKSVLEKGLNFSTVEKHIDKTTLLDDIYSFARKLKLKAFFDSGKTSNGNTDNKNSEEQE